MNSMRFSVSCLSACLLSMTAFGDDKPSATQDQPIGWASDEGGTTGGQGGKTVVVRTENELQKACRSTDTLIIHIAGTVRLAGNVRPSSNKTILGLGNDATLAGAGITIKEMHNIIVRNLTIRDGESDAINVESGSHHVWIDHCDLSKCSDGLLDIKSGSDFVTVSWNRFHDHQKTSLLGHSDKPAVLAGDKGKLRVTYHHNFFDGSGTRHPRVRVAETVHVFNNYYRNNEYGVASLMDAGVLVEGNYFEHVKEPTHTLYGASKEPGRLVERGNIFIESGPVNTRDTVREVKESYRYTLDDAAAVPKIVSQGAGAGKIAEK